ncbi:YcaO-like family protein [Bacillus mojavensis]|uniref:YcaO-like family protein n=1 Tax=Bacillus mojavensis TaxID=72360 RepID=UPI002DB8ECEC|nr:YcaO-like family protein [Bacillus mojavensis]MEC1736402.1 YcaO-like family protein [Bacillus mojavensis]
MSQQIWLHEDSDTAIMSLLDNKYIKDLKILRLKEYSLLKSNDIILFAQSSLNTDKWEKISILCKKNSAYLLFALFTPYGIWLGPVLHTSNNPICLHCLKLRLGSFGNSIPNPYAMFLNRSSIKIQLEEFHWFLPIFRSYLQEILSSRWENGTYICIMINEKGSLKINKHSFLPHPLCPVCSTIERDSKSAASLLIHKVKEESTSKKADWTLSQLSSTLFDPLSGIVKGEIVKDSPNTIPVSFKFVEFLKKGDFEPGVGRSWRSDNNHKVAFFEACERYAGQAPLGKKTTVIGNYQEVKKYAIHPAQFLLHTDDQYSEQDFPYIPFVEDEPISWVWGVSLTKCKATLIPERNVYYRLRYLTEENVASSFCLNDSIRRQYAYESSNGFAIRDTYAGAILNGLFEVCERDAFLCSWYNEKPGLDVTNLVYENTELSLMYLSVEQMGFKVRLFDISIEHGIPCIWAIALGNGIDYPATISAAGCNLDPILAIRSALIELSSILPEFIPMFKSKQERIRWLAEDERRVESMDDHALIYMNKEFRDRFDFLLEQSREITRTEILERMAQSRTYNSISDSQLLQIVLERIQKIGFEVLIVDTTPIDLKELGFVTVKVLIPGMLPMTFGSNMYRLAGSKRVPFSNLQRPKVHPFP